MTKISKPSEIAWDLTDNPHASSADRILLYLAINTMKLGGHRYGTFLDAAATAAKFAIYSTYLEQGRNLRKTGFLYHVEPKRVRAIVKEVEFAVREGKSLKSLDADAPYYLIGIPHLWQEKYPWLSGQPRVAWEGLMPKEKEQLEESLPQDLPPAQLLNSFQFIELLGLLHVKSQEDLPPEHRTPLSDAMLEHIKFRLLYSGTVLQIESPLLKIPFYALTRTHYSPRGDRERAFVMLKDVAQFFQILQAWAQGEEGVFRGVEAFDIDIQQREQALSELDTLLQAWADKYHQDGGYPMMLQLAVGMRTGDHAEC